MNRFPLAKRQLMETERKWNPDNGLLFLQAINDREARVCTFKLGITIYYIECNVRELLTCFQQFPVWILCNQGYRDTEKYIIKKVLDESPIRLIQSAKILGTFELASFYQYFKTITKSQEDIFAWTKLLGWSRIVNKLFSERLSILRPPTHVLETNIFLRT